MKRRRQPAVLIVALGLWAACGTFSHADSGLDEAARERIRAVESEAAALLEKMVALAPGFDSVLPAHAADTPDATLLSTLETHAKQNELIRKLLGEYRIQQAYIARLKAPGSSDKPVLTFDGEYPRLDGGALGRPDLPESIRNKPWSWARIHRYYALHKNGPYTEEEIQTIAKYDIVQLNFTDKDRELARKLKAHNPDIICIGYRNVIIWHESFDSDLFREHPDWFLRNYRSGKYETHGPSGPKAQKPLFDLRVPEMREWWIRDVGDQCASAEFDGILIDAITKALGDWGPKRRSVGADLHSKMAYSNLVVDQVLGETIEAHGDKGLIIANALRSGYEDCLKSYVDGLWHGSYLEWIESREALHYEELLSHLVDTCIQIGKDPGDKVLAFHFTASYPPPPKVDVTTANRSLAGSTVLPGLGEHFDGSGKTLDQIRRVMRDAFPYKLAIFLICADRYSYMSYGTSHRVNDPAFRWFPQYPEHERQIGKPLGYAVKKSRYYYEREFENLSVKLNLETRQAVLDWK